MPLRYTSSKTSVHQSFGSVLCTSEATIIEVEIWMEALAATVKEQASQIQKVSAQL